MAKKKKPKIEVKEPEITEEKHSFFPRLTILFSLVLIAIAVVSFFGVFLFPKLAMEIILLLAGLWLLKLGIGKGFYGRRKEILKKYI